MRFTGPFWLGKADGILIAMLVIIDYGMGNVGSVLNMLKRLGIEATLSSDPAVISKASKLVLPGVGAFDEGMRNLTARGFVSLLNRKVLHEQTPILGICLGLQLFSSRSEEGQLPGLGWLPAETRRFRFSGPHAAMKVPHMGWNNLEITRATPLFADFPLQPRYYFVHSYHVCCEQPRDVIAVANYGYDFTAAIQRDNIVGTQFHPEKSHRFGLRLLENFATRL
jgi:imidazole glycerol-phosphate synthase subunit HisH